MDTLLDFLKKEQFDILSFQEVSGDAISFDKSNTFKRICDLGYDGELSVTWRYKGNPHSFFGEAVFFKPGITFLGKNEVWLKPYMELETLNGFRSEDFPKSVLHIMLEKDNKRFDVLSAHLAWSPVANDTPEKIRQATIFANYLKTVKHPFILTGDFNTSAKTKVTTIIDQYARNLTSENNLKNTMNLRIHRDKERLIEQGGVAVDYIYVTKDWEVKKFDLLEELDLSDHLGLQLECSL
jgi:endonuclease/exonuclease/phosphatase family metal-dependent hydrolase